MKKALIILGRYFPKASPNAVCMQNIIDKMINDGYQIQVVSYCDECQYTGSIPVKRISRGLIQSCIYRLENKNTAFAKVVLKGLVTLKKVKDGMCFAIWPLTDPIFTIKTYYICRNLHKNQKYDYVICVHMPLSSLVVGYMLKKKDPNIKYIPYFLDSLSGGRPQRIFSEKWNLKKKLQWEKKLLPLADKIVVMESSKEHHEKYSKKMEYYNKFVYLDIPLLCKGTSSAIQNPYDPNYYNVTFCGTAIRPIRNMDFFSNIAKAVKTKEKLIRFYIIGDCNCQSILEDDNVFVLQKMGHDSLIPYLQNADALINFGVKTPSAISGKIFEYMAYGKPIISTYSIPNEACIPYLRRYPESLLIDEKNEEIDTLANSIVQFVLKTRNRSISIDEIYTQFSNNLPEAFINKVLANE